MTSFSTSLIFSAHLLSVPLQKFLPPMSPSGLALVKDKVTVMRGGPIHYQIWCDVNWFRRCGNLHVDGIWAFLSQRTSPPNLDQWCIHPPGYTSAEQQSKVPPIFLLKFGSLRQNLERYLPSPLGVGLWMVALKASSSEAPYDTHALLVSCFCEPTHQRASCLQKSPNEKPMAFPNF